MMWDYLCLMAIRALVFKGLFYTLSTSREKWSSVVYFRKWRAPINKNSIIYVFFEKKKGYSTLITVSYFQSIGLTNVPGYCQISLTVTLKGKKYRDSHLELYLREMHRVSTKSR